MSSRPSFAVRLGLVMVRVLLFFKASGVAFFSFFVPAGKIFGVFFLKLLVPGYRALFFVKRNMGAVYRPVKNRFMFVVSNRFAFYGVVGAIAVVGGVTNIRVNAVRAEADTIGQQSILYAFATQQRMEFVEEYNDPKDARAYIVSAEHVDSGVLVGSLAQVSSDALPLETSLGLFRADGAFALSVSGESPQASSSPRVRTEIETYVVEPGDTLSVIAERFGITVNTLLWSNNLTVRSVLKPGQELAILPVSGVLHTVKSGDTLLALAKKYQVDSSVIATYNALDVNASLRIGQKFIIPGGVITSSVAVSTTPATVKDIFTSAPAGSQGSSKPSSGVSMVWPTDLSIIVRGMSWFHTGYDIDCNGRANGTSTNDNYAAAGGTVLFAGTKNGYGNTVEIDHGNGLVTRYGHFYSLYVKSGQVVSAGDPLGRCGSTGNSSGTHLHFEVIDIATKKFLNPANYIRY